MQSASEKSRTYWQGIVLCWRQSEGWYTNFQNNFQAASIHHRVHLLFNPQLPSILSWFLQKALSMSLKFCIACRGRGVGSEGLQMWQGWEREALEWNRNPHVSLWRTAIGAGEKTKEEGEGPAIYWLCIASPCASFTFLCASGWGRQL